MQVAVPGSAPGRTTSNSGFYPSVRTQTTNPLTRIAALSLSSSIDRPDTSLDQAHISAAPIRLGCLLISQPSVTLLRVAAQDEPSPRSAEPVEYETPADAWVAQRKLKVTQPPFACCRYCRDRLVCCLTLATVDLSALMLGSYDCQCCFRSLTCDASKGRYFSMPKAEP